MNSAKSKLSMVKIGFEFAIEPHAEASTYRIKTKTMRAIRLNVSSRVRTEYVVDQVNIDGSDQ